VQKAPTNYFSVRARKRFYLGGFDDHGGNPAEHVGEERAKGLHEVGILGSRAKHTASLSKILSMLHLVSEAYQIKRFKNILC
jgi:hypothetical protein